MDDPIETKALEAAKGGDQEPIGALLESYRARLARMVSLRMDTRAQGRFDTSDVLQEAFIEATERLPSYLESRSMPFFLWVRFLVGQKLLQFHRTHLTAQVRDAAREISLSPPSGVGASAGSVASVWLAESGTPSQVASAEEEHARVRDALEGMGDIDREVLVLRHFEQLTNAEVATLLEITQQTASARYVRALTRIQSVVGGS